MMEPSSLGHCAGIFDRLSEISASDTEEARKGATLGFVSEVGGDYSAASAGYSDTF